MNYTVAYSHGLELDLLLLMPKYLERMDHLRLRSSKNFLGQYEKSKILTLIKLMTMFQTNDLLFLLLG